MKFLKRLWLIIPVLMLQGCPGGYGYKYFKGTFPSTPVNFTEINTEYDDYNASAPNLGESVPLCFSSNRNSLGADFDIVYKPFHIVFSKTTGELYIGTETDGEGEWMRRNSNLVNAVRKINTPENEFGPFLIHMDDDIRTDNEIIATYFILYSNEKNGNQDIRFTHNTLTGTYEEPALVSFLNSEADDAYPSFNPDRSALYLCSDRDQNFDIYRVELDPEKEILEVLSSEEMFPAEKDSILSSAWDDKCPFIANSSYEYSSESLHNNILVFASNREGGFGGFDLYYSLLEDGKWGEPINFGAGINTEYDEYRPIVRPHIDFTNEFMLFSSNRPGGLGGFDLYYVGIPNIGLSY
jgi:hypothetical protein